MDANRIWFVDNECELSSLEFTISYFIPQTFYFWIFLLKKKVLTEGMPSPLFRVFSFSQLCVPLVQAPLPSETKYLAAIEASLNLNNIFFLHCIRICGAVKSSLLNKGRATY